MKKFNRSAIRPSGTKRAYKVALEIKGQMRPIVLTPKQFQSLKDTFQRWIAFEAYVGK